MMDLAFLKPVYQLVQNEAVRAKMEESARLWWSNDDFNINLIPAIIVIILAAVVIPPLLGFPLLDSLLGGGGSGHYGAPDSGYGAPAAEYGAPATGYGAPASGYGAPASGYTQTARVADSSFFKNTIDNLQKTARYFRNPAGSGAQSGNSVGYSS